MDIVNHNFTDLHVHSHNGYISHKQTTFLRQKEDTKVQNEEHTLLVHWLFLDQTME